MTLIKAHLWWSSKRTKETGQLHYFWPGSIQSNKQRTTSSINVRLSIENQPNICAIARRNFVNSRLIRKTSYRNNKSRVKLSRRLIRSIKKYCSEFLKTFSRRTKKKKVKEIKWSAGRKSSFLSRDLWLIYRIYRKTYVEKNKVD